MHNTIGTAIREARQAAELMQDQLAERSGVTQGHLSLIERGERVPGLGTLHKLRDALEPDDATWLAWIDLANPGDRTPAGTP